MILHAVEAGEGPSVALLHGLFGQGRNLGAVQRGLASRHRVLALDLRNHGASPHDAVMSYPAMAGDVLETLAERGALPVALVGHSMGGKVAMQVALQRPEAVRRLLVADIAPVAYRAGGFHAYAAAMAALLPGPASAADQALAEAVPDAAVRAFLLQNRRPDGSWRIGLPEIARALPAIEGWDPPARARYEGPALFLRGERSGYVREEHRPAIRALFPAARFVTLREAGHWVHADNPAGFLQIVQAFAGG